MTVLCHSQIVVFYLYQLRDSHCFIPVCERLIDYLIYISILTIDSALPYSRPHMNHRFFNLYIYLKLFTPRCLIPGRVRIIDYFLLRFKSVIQCRTPFAIQRICICRVGYDSCKYGDYCHSDYDFHIGTSASFCLTCFYTTLVSRGPVFY